MSKTMTKKMKDAAKIYKLDEISTPEKLELQGFKTIAYGTETICIGYFYSPDGKCYYTATYEFINKSQGGQSDDNDQDAELRNRDRDDRNHQRTGGTGSRRPLGDNTEPRRRHHLRQMDGNGHRGKDLDNHAGRQHQDREKDREENLHLHERKGIQRRDGKPDLNLRRAAKTAGSGQSGTARWGKGERILRDAHPHRRSEPHSQEPEEHPDADVQQRGSAFQSPAGQPEPGILLQENQRGRPDEDQGAEKPDDGQGRGDLVQG